jgi:hypothetical protein
VGVKLLTVVPLSGDILIGVLGTAASTASGLSRGNATAAKRLAIMKAANHLPSPLHSFTMRFRTFRRLYHEER